MQCEDPWKPLAMKTANSKKEKDGKMIWKQSSNTEITKKRVKIIMSFQTEVALIIQHDTKKGYLIEFLVFIHAISLDSNDKKQFFKISSFYIPQKKVIRVWNKMRVTKCSHFWVNAHLRCSNTKFMLPIFNGFITVRSFKIVENEIKQVRKARQKRSDQ